MAPLPADLQDRRVEITGPTDAKMVINALNSGASLYMADFEDSNCPTWANTLEVGVENFLQVISNALNPGASFVERRPSRTPTAPPGPTPWR